MVTKLSELRVVASMDASGYTAGMAQKVAADQRGAASSGQVGAAIKATDTKVSQSGDVLTRLSRSYVDGFSNAERFSRAVSTLGRGIETGNVPMGQAETILDGIQRKHGLVANAADLAEHGHYQLAAAVTALNSKLTVEDAALDLNSEAHRRNAAAMRMAGAQRTNLMFQLQDIGVSLAGGMNPLMVAMQQGSQISMIYGNGEGGLGRALSETGKMAVGLVTKLWPVAAAVGLASAAIGGMTAQINEASDVQVNFGHVAMSAWQLFASGVANFVRPAIEKIGDWIGSLVDWLTPVVKGVGNTIIAVFDGAYSTVVETWNMLPDAFASLFIKAMNGAIDIVENGINGIVGPINSLLEKVGMSGLATADLSGFKGTPSNADSDVAGIAGKNFGRAFSTDYMGQYYDAVAGGARKLALAEAEAAKGADKSNEAHKKLAREGLSDAQKEAQKLADTIEQTLGSALGSLFDGPLTSVQDAMDGILGSFAQIGQQNLQSLFTGTIGANDNKSSSWADAQARVFGDAVRDGAKAGTLGGFGDVIKAIPGGAGSVSAGLGGLGIGYQTQNPLMGAVGGALAGASAGPWGAVIGGIAGLVGGLIGMNAELEKNKKLLGENKQSINAFIGAGYGKEIDATTAAVIQYKAQAAEYIKLAQAAGDQALVKRLKDAAAAYRDTLKADAVRDRFKEAKDDLLNAYQSQADGLQAVIDRTRDFIATTEQFRSSLMFDKQYSPLSPQQMLAESQKQFDLLSKKAQLGDANAQGRLQGASTEYLNAARGYLGSSAGYQDIFDRVQGVLGSVVGAAGTQLSSAQQQLEATNKTITHLGGIEIGVQTVASIMERMTKLQIEVSKLRGDEAKDLRKDFKDFIKEIRVIANKKAG